MPNLESQGLGFTPTRTLPRRGGGDTQVIDLNNSLSPGVCLREAASAKAGERVRVRGADRIWELQFRILVGA